MSKDDNYSNKNKNNKKRKFWAIKIFILTFFIACLFSIVSEAVIINIGNLLLAVLTIFVIILIGIIFDIIGIAVASASEIPFISMASKKIRGAPEAIHLIRNADQVSSFCNDVVGDICGIVSGAAGSVLVMKTMWTGSLLSQQGFLSIIISSIIAALTVGGKAYGKTIAIKNHQKVVYYTACFLSLLTDRKHKTKNVGLHERERNR